MNFLNSGLNENNYYRNDTNDDINTTATITNNNHIKINGTNNILEAIYKFRSSAGEKEEGCAVA